MASHLRVNAKIFKIAYKNLHNLAPITSDLISYWPPCYSLFMLSILLSRSLNICCSLCLDAFPGVIISACLTPALSSDVCPNVSWAKCFLATLFKTVTLLLPGSLPQKHKTHRARALFCLVLYLQCLERVMAHGGYSINTFWMNK